MKFDLAQDVKIFSTLTYTDQQRYYALVKKLISGYVVEDEDEITEIDIGIGNLYIQKNTDGIRYKFTPSEDFESILINSIKSEKQLVVEGLESEISKIILHAYKDLL